MDKANFENNNISGYDYYKFYLKNSRLFGLIWFFISVCFTILLIIVFISPEWIGDSQESKQRGYFGLYSFCVYNRFLNAYECSGSWADFNLLPNAIRVSSIFIGTALIISGLSIVMTVLMFFIKPERVFHICAWFQFFSMICLLVGLCVYPIGWSSDAIRSVCGDEADQFRIGTCSLRWPFVIAIIALIQIFFLTALAFLLAARQAKFILLHASANRFDYNQEQQNVNEQSPYATY